MTWIATHPPTPDHPAVAQVMETLANRLPPEYHPSRRRERQVPTAVMNDNVVLSHSLLPDVMFHSFAAFAALCDSSLPLTRRQQEMINTTVSVLNRCFY